MCGIAGIVDLKSTREIDPNTLARMAAAIEHRGPDEEGFLHEPGIGLASRRLSIVGLADGQQPVFSEDRQVVVVYNGELFDYVELRQALRAKGHRFRTSCDTELLVHLWQEYGERMFDHLHGQFAFALYDFHKQVLILARDRVGICPLHWTRQGDWLYFGSEVKAILASGEVEAKADPKGIDHILTFFAIPSRRTPFAGIQSLNPGTFLRIELGGNRDSGRIDERTYWDLDFPDAGQEWRPANSSAMVEGFLETLSGAVERRLRADVPVVSYLSGGIDSAAVLALSSKIRGSSPPSFTIRIPTPRYDETIAARRNAELFGSEQTVVTCDAATLSNTYPALIQAADSPVIDTACAALHCLSAEVHRQGYKVALTGEGSDEALAGYPWFKINKLLGLADTSFMAPSQWLRPAILFATWSNTTWAEMKQSQDKVGGPLAQTDFYSMYMSNRAGLYSDSMRQSLAGFSAYDDLSLNLERLRRWHPLNQSIYLGYKTILPGLLINHKGDRVAMANSVETRYPFLDDEMIAYCAKLPPEWELKGLLRDKHVLRESMRGLLPREIVDRPKAMFRAPFGDTFFQSPPNYVSQLLSPESLRRTGYFSPQKVERAWTLYRQPWVPPWRKLFVEMGLAAVVSVQLWHHLYLGGELCELPVWSPPEPATLENVRA